MNTLKESLASTASTLAELHRNGLSLEPPAQDYVGFHESLLLKQVSDLKQKSFDPQQQALMAGLGEWTNSVVEQMRANPGQATVAHNDAHPGNFFYDPIAQTTTIDTLTLHFTIDDREQGMACAARDYGNFMQRLGHYGHTFGLSEPEISEIQGHFKKHYMQQAPEMTQETVDFWRTRSSVAKLTTLLQEKEEELVRAPDKAAKLDRAATFELKQLQALQGEQQERWAEQIKLPSFERYENNRATAQQTAKNQWTATDDAGYRFHLDSDKREFAVESPKQKEIVRYDLKTQKPIATNIAQEDVQHLKSRDRSQEQAKSSTQSRQSQSASERRTSSKAQPKSKDDQL